MTRRHDALIPLSHDHHHALHEVRVLKNAADATDSDERATASRVFIDFFRADSIAHFREEEEVIFPVVTLEAGAPMEGIVRVLEEHVRLHALVRRLEHEPGDAGTMREIAQLLRAHIRFEEDELFPAIERVASKSLDGLVGSATLDVRSRPGDRVAGNRAEEGRDSTGQDAG